MATKEQLKNIEKFHSCYRKYIMGKHRKYNNPESSKHSIEFIFSLSFNQGRSDEVSSKFRDIALEHLKEKGYEEIEPLESVDQNPSKEELKEQYENVLKSLENDGLNKEGDRLMYVNTIALERFIYSQCQCKNTIEFLIEKIKQGNIKRAYEVLDQVWSIGPKIASIILREIVVAYDLEESSFKGNRENYRFVQPIDTWVKQVSERIGIIDVEKDNRQTIIDKIVNVCLDSDVSPIKYNEGAWFIGANSFEALLNCQGITEEMRF